MWAAALLLVVQSAQAGPEIAVFQGAGVTGPGLTHSVSAQVFQSQVVHTASSIRTVTLSNAGDADLTISSVTLTGTGSSRFIADTSGLLPTVAPGGTCSFSIVFQPTTTGLKQAVVHIVSNDAGEPSFDFHLAGTGRTAQTGKVMGWGNNTSGQCNVPAGLEGVTGITAGDAHVLAMKSDGSVAAWGNNGYGQSAVPPGLSGVVAIAAGLNHSLALKSDGTVSAWGRNHAGQSTVPAGLSDVVAVSAGGDHCLALKADGTVIAWGRNTYGQRTVPPGLSAVVAVAAGGEHSLALIADGTVVAWGDNYFGQSTVPPTLSGVVAIAAGYWGGAAVKSNGSVVTWGLSNVPGGLTGVTALVPGGTNGLALSSSTRISYWGLGFNGYPDPSTYTGAFGIAAGGGFNLILGAQDLAVLAWSGIGTTAVGQTSTPGGFRIYSNGLLELKVSSISLTGPNASEFLLDTTGLQTNLPWGYTTNFTVSFRPTRGGVRTATLNIVSDDPDENPYQIPLSVTAIGFPTIAIYEGAGISGPSVPPNRGAQVFRTYPVGSTSTPRTFTVRNSGSETLVFGAITLSGTGSSQFTLDSSSLPASLGPGETSSFSVSFHPTSAGLHQALIQITSNDDAKTTFPIPLAGTGRSSPPRTVVAWGSNAYGQSTPPATLSGVVDVAAGARHTLALKSDGTVVAWGANDLGQTVVPAGLNEVVAISTQMNHSLALKGDGTVVAWGANNGGQCNVPQGLSGVVAVAAGLTHSVALKSDSSVVIWGTNAAGISRVEGMVAVAAGSAHNLALRLDGTVYAWAGPNQYGECTVPPGLSDVVALAAGGSHSIARRRDGTLVSWGSNSNGEGAVPGGLGAVLSVAAHGTHNLALKSDGMITGWGQWDATKVPFGLTEVTAVATGDDHSVVLGRLTKPLPQAITFNPPSTLYVYQELTLAAWSSAGLAVKLTVESGGDKATLVGRQLTANAEGTIKIRASQAGANPVGPAADVIRTMVIKPNPASLTLLNLTQTYDGSPKPIAVAGPFGTHAITYNGSSQPPANAGTYAVKVILNDVNGRTFSQSGTLTIGKAPLWVRCDDQRRLVTQANPPLTFRYHGFLGTDTAAVLQSLPVASTAAKATSIAGQYPIITKGSSAANYALVHVPGTLVIEGFGTAFEALLTDANGRAAGKLELTLNATGTSFSAKVLMALDSAPLTFAGSTSLDATDEEVTGAKAMANTKSNVTHELSFTVDLAGALTARLTRAVGTDAAVSLLSSHGQMLLARPAQPLPFAGAHTLLMEPAQTAPGFPAATTPTPAGSGWATATISTSGLLNLTGVLGDGTSFTASLNPDIAAEPGYRLFSQPYKPARTGTFVGGVFSLAIHPTRAGRRYLPEVTLHWAKAAEAKDPTYPEGFANLDVTGMFDPWLAPSKSANLATLVGVQGAGPLRVFHSTTGNATQDATLPANLILSDSKLTVPDPKNNPAKWLTTLNAATGQLTGSFELTDAPNKKRSVRFTGVLRQPALTGDALVGGGHFILPPAPGAAVGQKPTTGDMSFLKPAP